MLTFPSVRAVALFEVIGFRPIYSVSGRSMHLRAGLRAMYQGANLFRVYVSQRLSIRGEVGIVDTVPSFAYTNIQRGVYYSKL